MNEERRVRFHDNTHDDLINEIMYLENIIVDLQKYVLILHHQVNSLASIVLKLEAADEYRDKKPC